MLQVGCNSAGLFSVLIGGKKRNNRFVYPLRNEKMVICEGEEQILKSGHRSTVAVIHVAVVSRM